MGLFYNIQQAVNKVTNYLGITKPDYIISVSGTPADQTRTTSGTTISTPGTPAQPGISVAPPSVRPSGGGGGGGGSSAQTTTQKGTLDTAIKLYESNKNLTSQQKKDIFSQIKAQQEANKNIVKRNVSKLDQRNISKQDETYKEIIRRLGPVTGTFEYVGEKAKELVKPQKLGYLSDYYPYETKGTYNPLSSEEEERRINIKTEGTKEAVKPAIKTTAYLTPAGFGIMIAEGVESYGFPGGRENIKQTAETLSQDYGIPSGLAKGIAWLLPAAEIGMGSLGLKGQIKGKILSREQKLFSNTPTEIIGKRIETEKGGLDILVGYKKAGKSEYLTTIKQPFYKAGEEKIVFESGKGIAYKLKGNKIDVVGFETSGRAYPGGKGRAVTKTPEGIIISKEIEAETGFGRIISKEKFRGQFNLKKMVSPSGELSINAKGMIQPSSGITKETFLGFSREEGDIIKILGAKGKKLKYFPEGDKFVLSGELESFGNIKRLNLPSIGESEMGGVLKSFTKTRPSYAKSLIESGTEKLLSKGIFKPEIKITGKIISPILEIKEKIPFPSLKLIEENYLTYVGGSKSKDIVIFNQGMIQPGEQVERERFFIPLGYGMQQPVVQIPEERLISIPVEVPGITTRQEEKLRFKIPPFYPGSYPRGTPTKTPGLPPGFYIPKLPKFSMNNLGSSNLGGTQVREYLPSLYALGFNIKAFKIPKSYTKGLGALTLRPIISSRKKSRRKK